jgi:hypothetical protein
MVERGGFCKDLGEISLQIESIEMLNSLLLTKKKIWRNK